MFKYGLYSIIFAIVSKNDINYGSFVPRGKPAGNNESVSILKQISPESTEVKKQIVKKTPVMDKKVESLRTYSTARPADFVKKENNPQSSKKNKKKPVSSVKSKYSIGGKLIGIISAIVSLSLILITVLVSYYISSDVRVNAEENNLTINSRTAADTESRFNSIISSVGMFYDNISSDDEKEELQNKAARFFERNKGIVAFKFIYDDDVFVNRVYFAAHELDSELVNLYSEQESEKVDRAKNGIVSVMNATPFFGEQIVAIFTPIRSDDNNDVVVIYSSLEELSESYSTSSINLSFLVNDDGTIIVHPDLDLMKRAAEYRDHYLVKLLPSAKTGSEQLTYVNTEDVEYIGAFTKLSFAGCAVITEVQTRIVLEAVNATTRRNVYLTIAILSIAIMIVWFFSKSLSTPLKELTAVTNEINAGNFETPLLNQLKTKRKDEIGVLIRSTKAEQEILNTFTRLTNKGVTRAIVTHKIDFQPHLKDITIFFSDIRGFTAISDGFNKRFGEKSAGEIIGFLNDYMGRMVNCISISGGNVDKFEGDAIMACWGVLRDDSLDYEKWPDSDPRKAKFKAIHEKHVKQDAVSAIMATTAMRYALMEYNKKAEAFTKAHEGEPYAKYKPHIRIGSGLNSGRATVGFMGSYDKMEFTSIGDAVNLASRTESSNKPCGTDMLITQDTYDLLKKDFIRCPENNYKIKPENLKYEVVVEVIPVTFEVKGKGKQHFYGVVNMPQFDIEGFFRKGDPKFKLDPDCARAIGPKGPKTLAEVRTLLGIPTPDFGEVNLDAEESKIKAT